MNKATRPAKLPVPTGNPWIPSPADPATVPVPVPVIIVSVNGPYTERDRKLWTLLLQAVLGCLNRALTVDRFLDSGCQTPLSFAL